MNGSPLHDDAELAVLIAKVERLWRKARSTTFPAEAEAYEEKALYLMARARITDAMLDLDGADDRNSIVDVKIGAPLSGGYRIPAESLFDATCRAYGCRGYLFVSGRTSQPAAVGFGGDVARVTALWPLLLNDALGSARQLRGRAAAETRAMRRSAMFGFSAAIAERFEAIHKRAVADQDSGAPVDGDVDADVARSLGATPSAGSELVLRQRDRRVDDAFRELGVRHRRRRVSGGYGGFEHGHRAGMEADLSAGRTSVRRGGKALGR